MRWLYGVLALAGCDKLLLTEIPSPPIDAAVVGHNEDQDDLADAEDNCPHIAGSHVDSDSDGVGDLCDPNPNAQDQIAAFYPFDMPNPMFQAVAGSWNLTNDTLVHQGNTDFSKYVARGGLTLKPPYVIEARFKFDKAPDNAEFSISTALDLSDFGCFCTLKFTAANTEIHAFTPGQDGPFLAPPLDCNATFTARITVAPRKVSCAITSSVNGAFGAATGMLGADVRDGPAGLEGRYADTTTEYMIICTPKP